MPNTQAGGQYARTADAADRRLSFSLSSATAELQPLAEAVECFAESHGWPPDLILQINLALEELVVNAIDYGYPDGREGHIDITLDTTPSEIWIRIEDDGDAFDPFGQPTPDLTGGLEERAIGGLGIHLVRSYMDSCAYIRAGGRNRVSLAKRLPPPSA